MAALRAEKLEALSKGVYDPLEIETDFRAEEGTWLDPDQIEHGDVLRDPKVRPSGYVHPILRTNFETEIEKVKEKNGQPIRSDTVLDTGSHSLRSREVFSATHSRTVRPQTLC